MPTTNFGPFSSGRGSSSRSTRGNPNGASAKESLKKLAGELVINKATLSQAKVHATRVAQANGTPVKAAVALVEKEHLPVIRSIEYAMAALKVFQNKFPGKSATKMATSLGLMSVTPGSDAVDDRFPNER
jgi:hypothetical protein